MKQYFKNISVILRKSANFIKIDFSFFIIFVLAFLLDEITLYFWFIVFGVLHELAHFYVGKKLGYIAKNIRLNFFGAVLEGFDDFVLEDEIKVVLAGPIFNLLVSIFCYLSFWFYPESYNYLYEVLVVNLSLFLFNFLPVFPLDFGRFLLAFFTRKLKRNDALKKVKLVSIIFIFLLMILHIISLFFDFNFTLGFVAVNLLCLMFESSKNTSYKRTLFVERKKRLLEKGLINRTICVNSDVPKYKLLKFIDDSHHVTFLFLDSSFQVKDKMTEMELYSELEIM